MTTTTPGSGEVQDFVYGYDNNGNILTITDNVTPANSQTFSYDWLNRLATARGPYGTINYNTDPAGNVQNPPSTASGAYSSGQALVYDYDNRVTSINSTSFVYDDQGARVQKIDGPNITTYVSRLYDINTTNGVTKHIFAGGRRIASINGSNISYYHPDHLGSLSIATNGSGSMVQQVTYLPYGEVNTNWYSGTDLPYKFTGHELDAETGLCYCGARYYDASQGRFLTPDTIVQSPGDPQTLNRYAYARNNPLVITDPSGHCGLQDIIIGGLICLGLSEAAATAVFTGMLLGAALGATISALTGGNPLTGAITGAIAGGLFAGAGSLAGALNLVTADGAYTSTQALIEASLLHAGAGAASGAIGAAIGCGNVGLGALTGGLSGGIAEGVGLEIQGTNWLSSLQPDEKIFAGLASRVGIGAVTGGVTSEIVNGQFLHGFGQGAWTAAYGFLFNDLLHSFSVSAAGFTAQLSQGDWQLSIYLTPNALIGWSYDTYSGAPPTDDSYEVDGASRFFGAGAYYNSDNGGSGFAYHVGQGLAVIPFLPLSISLPCRVPVDYFPQ